MISDFFDYLKTHYFLVLFFCCLPTIFLFSFSRFLPFLFSLFYPPRRLPKHRSDNISDIYQDPWDIPDIDVD